MEYQKVGRGGAGNFYSPQDLDKASRDTTGDAEAQRNVAGAGVQDLESHGRKASTSGRGGAGNVTTRDALAAGTSANIDVTPSMQESKTPDLGHYGRGGAGNYRRAVPEEGREGEKDALETEEQAHRKVVEDVEMGLREPEKAHLGREGREYEGYDFSI